MNNTANITCPKCGAEIPLTEAIGHQLREQLAAELKQERKEQNAALAEREAKLAKAEGELNERAKAVEEQVAKQLAVERKELVADAAQKAEEKVSVELKALRSRLDEQRTRLKNAQEAELQLLKQKGELEEGRERLRLDLARQLNAERGSIAEKARNQAIEAERRQFED